MTVEQPPQVMINEVTVNISGEVAQGHYCNMMLITHTPVDFTVDFIQNMPNIPVAQGRVRVIIAPANLKSMVQAMVTNLATFEKNYGIIEVIVNPVTEAPPAGEEN